MASVEKRGSRYAVRWRDPDGEQRFRLAPTRAAANELRREVEASVALGRRWEPPDARPRPRVRELGAAWLTSCARRLQPRTLVRYGQILDDFVGWVERRHGPRAGPEVLSVRLLEDYQADLAGDPGPRGVRSPPTVFMHLNMVQAWWSWCAARDEYAGLVPPARSLELAAPATARREAPTWADMDAAILAATGWRREVAVVMRCTGLRVGQALRLRREDLDGDRLVIRPELGKSRQERRGRTVPVAPALLDELRTRTLCDWSDPDWIVSCARADRVARADDLERAWTAAGVPPARWRGRPDHSFRAGFQTGLLAQGARHLAVEYLVGHRLPGTAESYLDPWKALGLSEAVAMIPPLPRGAP